LLTVLPKQAPSVAFGALHSCPDSVNLSTGYHKASVSVWSSTWRGSAPI